MGWRTVPRRGHDRGLKGETVDHVTSVPERAAATHELMKRDVAAIYHGILVLNDLVGEPDLLVRTTALVCEFGDYGYNPVAMKSGNAFVDAAKSKPPAYAVQLCAYADMFQYAQGCRPILVRTPNCVQPLCSSRDWLAQFSVSAVAAASPPTAPFG